MVEADQNSVVTVRGRIDPDELGQTMMHEHLLCDISNWFVEPDSAYEKKLAKEPVSMENLSYVRRNQNANKDNYMLDSFADAMAEAEQYSLAGGDTIVDVTPKGAGQDVKRVKAISEKLDIHIVQGTSYYVKSQHPDKISDMDQSELKDEFVSDVTDGIKQTDIRAGIIGEIGLSANPDVEIYEDELKVLRAGVQAAKETGAPMSIHPPGHLSPDDHPWPTSRWSLEVLDMIENMGLPPEQVVFCHNDRMASENLEYQKQLAERGAYLEYDRFGSGVDLSVHNVVTPSDWWRVQKIKQLVDSGYSSKILLSNDICTKIGLTKFGGDGYAHILEDILPLMKHAGITNSQINEMLITNPKSVLAFDKPQ